MAIVDLALNPISSPSISMSFIGYYPVPTDNEVINLDMYDFLINPIRDKDISEGDLFLKRFLIGFQNVWVAINRKVYGLKDLWSVLNCQNQYLQYLKNIVGWTSELDHITDDLDYVTLRRLIATSVPLWKSRTTENSISDVLNLLLASRSIVWSWFDLRWVLDLTIMSEEHQGRDPWLLASPGGVSASEYRSIIRLVNKDLSNRTLIKNIVNLMRPGNERYTIVYLLFLDLFEIDGDLAQWDVSGASSTIEVDGGMISLADDTSVETVYTNDDGSLLWKNFMVFARIRGTSGTAGQGFGVSVYLQTVDNFFYAILSIADNKLYFGKMIGGSPTTITTFDFSTISYTINANVWYGLRIQACEEGATNRIIVWFDGVEILNFTDGTWDWGTAGIHHNVGVSCDCSDFEMMQLPATTDEVDINY